jgi:glycosyltransferase involved in cell wall biosynthesis
MRVLHISSGTLYGGIETLLVSLARSRVLCPKMESEFAVCADGRLYTELLAVGATVHQLGATRVRYPSSILRARREMAQILSGSYDVAICHHVMAQAIFGPVVRAGALPLVFWAHSTLHGRHWTERIAGLTSPDLVIYSSRFTSEAVPRIYPTIPAEVIYPLFAAPNIVDARAQVRSEFGTPDETTVVVQASRLQEWKGHQVLLEALACVDRNLDWECWIVGGPQRRGEAGYLRMLNEIAAQLKIEDRVRFLGQREDVPRLFRGADIYCQPNTTPEPFGLAFVEALEAGLPVIATALGGSVEIVDPSCGILVRPNDPMALARTLGHLLSDKGERVRLGHAGPGRASHLCDPEQQLDRMARVFSRIAMYPRRFGHGDTKEEPRVRIS